MIVMKFGGTSVGSAKGISLVSDLVIRENRQRVVVVSAMTGITDELNRIAKKVINIPSSVVEEEVERFQRGILSRHNSVANAVIKDNEILKDILNSIAQLSDELKIALLGVGYLEELSPKSLDYILSFGERFSVQILTGVLRSRGENVRALTGYEAGIITDSSFGQARPIHERIKDSIKNNLRPLLDDGIIPVVTGFIAADEKGSITTLGRGGSDYTASLIGKYLDAEEVQIWTDVDGILTADPRIVPEARLIPTLSYVEASDLAYFGTKVIHSKMIEPAMDSNIPVYIKNTFNPDCKGTLIVKEQEKIGSIVKALSIAKNVTIVSLKGVGMAETPNIAGKIFTELGRNNINIIMISGSSETNLSFVIRNENLSDAVELLNARFIGNGIRNLELIENVCIITVVGVGMQGTKGIAAKIFNTVAEENVNIIMIAQGSSEVNISFIVREEDGDRTLRALHRRFIEKSQNFT